MLVPKLLVGLGMVVFEVALVAEKCCSVQLLQEEPWKGLAL